MGSSSFRFICEHCNRSQTNQTCYRICSRCHSDHLDVVAAVRLLRQLATTDGAKQLAAYLIAGAAAKLSEDNATVVQQAKGLMRRVKIHIQNQLPGVK